MKAGKFLVLLLTVLLFSPLLAGQTILPWRNYSVYQPRITKDYICNPEFEKLQYNHCSSIAFFKDTWIAMWNANTVPKESEPNQLIYMATSSDARNWTAPELCFASEQRSINPVKCKLVQWQPTLTVYNNRLWAFWSQLSFTGPYRKIKDEYYGCYFSVLKRPEGKWFNRRLTWNGDPDPVFNGKKYRILPMQNPAWTATGRILVPIIMIGPPAEDVPGGEKVWTAEKRVSVLYSDDKGKTWHVSYGAALAGRSWCPWEPTVWQQPDGSIAMLCRNGVGPMLSDPENRPTAFNSLLSAQSFYNGRTWSTLEPVPIETVISRMHVIRQDQFAEDVPSENERFILVHNDAHHLEPASLLDRNSLSLYFTRGGGCDFMAGIQFTGHEPIVSYPHMWRKDDTLHISYTQGIGFMGIKIAHINPLPDQDKYYIFPRSLHYPDSARPIVNDNSIYFRGDQHVDVKPDSFTGKEGFSAGVWFRNTVQGVFFDLRSNKGQSICKWSVSGGRADLTLPGINGNFRPDHNWMRFHRWTYLGITVNRKEGTIDFYIDGKRVDRREFAPSKVAFPEFEKVMIGDSPEAQGIVGHIRYLTVYPEVLTDRQHRSLYNKFASEFKKTLAANSEKIASEPALEMNPAQKEAFFEHVILPEPGKGGTIEIDTFDGKNVLRFHGEISAGLDLDHNERSRGDAVEVTFDFIPENDNKNVICSVGDMANPVRVIHNQGKLTLNYKDFDQQIGEITKGWNCLSIISRGNETSVGLNGGQQFTAYHKPSSTWFYLGQGSRTKKLPTDSSFIVNISSVKSRVTMMSNTVKTKDIHIRDPFVVPVKEERAYYLFGTTDEDCWNSGEGFDCYRSSDLKNWEGPIPAFRPDRDFWSKMNYWAPEVHPYNGKYYMFASFYNPGERRGTQILVSDSPQGPYTPLADRPVTPEQWECLDGTFYQEKGKNWMIFCHEWVQIEDGSICAMQLSDDLTNAISEPVKLFNASDAPWVSQQKARQYENAFITDGPFIHITKDNRMIMLWSSFAAGYEHEYAIGTAYSESGNILGPWKHNPEPVYISGGHGMIFKGFDGRLILSIHKPNKPYGTERPLFLPVVEDGWTIKITGE